MTDSLSPSPSPAQCLADSLPRAEPLPCRDRQPLLLTPDDLQSVIGGIAIIGTLVRKPQAS